MGRSFVTTGRMVMMRSTPSAISEMKEKRKRKKRARVYVRCRQRDARKFFQEILGLEGSKRSREKPPVSYEEIFRQNFLTHNFLRKFWLEFSQPRKFWSPKFPGDKRKFYEEILGSLDNRTEISTFSQYWMMPTTCTQLCSLLYSHMHRVTQTLPQEPWRTCVAGLPYSLEWWLTFFVFSPGSSRRGLLIIPEPDMQGAV